VWPVPPSRRVARLRGTATDTPVVSPDCRYVASGASSGAITVWDTTTDELHTLEGHPHWVNALVFTLDGTQLLSTDQTSLRSWDLDTMQGRTLRTTTGGRLKAVRALSDGHIAVIDRDEILVLGDDDATPTCRVPGTHYRISADARTAAVHIDGVIKLVELPSCRVREIARSDEATAIALSPDGSQVAMVGGASGHAALFDVARSTTRELDGREASGYLAYSSDGALVAAAGYYGTVRVWDAATGKVRRTFLGHKGSVGRAKFSPDNTRLASIDAVGAIRVWTLDGDDFEVYRGHTSNVMGVAFCARGDYMVTSGFDGTLRLWPTTPAHPRPTDAAGLRAWLDTVTTARADKEGRIGSPE
jgi:WD40 repeat protein